MVTNSDSESETTAQRTKSNGGSLMEEQEPLDQFKEETMLSLTKMATSSESMLLLSSDNSKDNQLKLLDGSMDQEETSEMLLTSALMFMVIPIPTTDMLSSTTATTV